MCQWRLSLVNSRVPTKGNRPYIHHRSGQMERWTWCTPRSHIGPWHPKVLHPKVHRPGMWRDQGSRASSARRPASKNTEPQLHRNWPSLLRSTLGSSQQQSTHWEHMPRWPDQSMCIGTRRLFHVSRVFDRKSLEGNHTYHLKIELARNAGSHGEWSCEVEADEVKSCTDNKIWNLSHCLRTNKCNPVVCLGL